MINMDVKISSDQGGVGEGADQRKKILKIFKEIFGGLVRKAVETRLNLALMKSTEVIICLKL